MAHNRTGHQFMALDPENMVRPNQPLPTTNRTNYSHVPPLNPFSAVELRLFKPLTEEEEYQRQIKLLPRIKRWLGLSNEPIRPENLKPSTFYQNIKNRGVAIRVAERSLEGADPAALQQFNMLFNNKNKVKVPLLRMTSRGGKRKVRRIRRAR